jgi:hypothetical protein
MMFRKTSSWKRDGAGAVSAQSAPLIESNSYQYYIFAIVRRRDEPKALHYAMELSAHEADRLREFDRCLSTSGYDMEKVSRERKGFISVHSAGCRHFWAAADKYAIGFLPKTDAQELIRKI